MCRKHALVLGLITLLLGAPCFGESTVVNSTALLRTRLIQTTKGIGTMFAVEVDGRDYWITAKHVITGVENSPPGVFPDKTVQVNVLSPAGGADEGPNKEWAFATFTVIDPGKDIDILVLVPREPLHLLPDVPIKLARESNPAGPKPLVPIGGDCEFLGYPYGGGWNQHTEVVIANGVQLLSEAGIEGKLPPRKPGWVWLPFVRHSILSGSITQNGIKIFVLDGINNLGFSGGPVLAGNGDSQVAFAVISGYHSEPLEVLPKPDHGQAYVSPVPIPSDPQGKKTEPAKKEIVESNSGLTLAYDITPALEAIRAHPIGPLHTTQSAKAPD